MSRVGTAGLPLLGQYMGRNSVAMASQLMASASRTNSWFRSRARSRRMVPIWGRSWVVALGFIGTPESGGSPPTILCTSYLKSFIKLLIY